MDIYQGSRKTHVPVFGSWEYADAGLPFTQCFQSARQAGLHQVCYGSCYPAEEDRDLYVAGDLYQNDVVTPALILVPRRLRKEERDAYAQKQPRRRTGVDEDLYKIPSELLRRPAPKRKPGFGFFSSCLMPLCV